MLTAPEIIQHLEQRIEELKKLKVAINEDGIEFTERDIECKITELESLLKKAKGI